MRYNAAQFIAMYEGDLWLRSASHANAMASRLARGIEGLDGVTLMQPQRVNSLFVQLPAHTIKPLQEEFHFYDWSEAESIVRLVCSWDTTEADVDAFIRGIRSAVSA